MTLCSIKGCVKPLRNGSYMCEMHYYRLYRHGDVNKRLRNANGEGGYSRNYFGWTVGKVKIREHVLVAERALGHALPKGALVHHVDENPANNKPSNLVICPNRGYHSIVHARMKALAVSGDANKKPCKFCKKYDDAMNLVKNGTSHHHRDCASTYNQTRKYLI